MTDAVDLAVDLDRLRELLPQLATADLLRTVNRLMRLASRSVGNAELALDLAIAELDTRSR